MKSRFLAALSALCLGTIPSASIAQAAPFFSLETMHQALVTYTPARLQTAYNISPLLDRGVDGSGQTIALIELDTFAASDLQHFDATNHLPAPSIQQIYAGGTSFALKNEGETTMDVEWAHALAPGAHILVYYLKNQNVNSAGWKGIAQAVSTSVSRGATAIAFSYSACGPSNGYQATQKAFAAAEAAGVSVFVSSGDFGDRAGPVKDCGKQLGVAYPASDPSIVSVGGTSLSLNSDATIQSETAWSLSGGGKGKPLLRPAWQITTNLLPGRYRYAPDVSFLADPQMGADTYWRGHWVSGGGTSLGAPAWAAIWALIQADAQQAGTTAPAAPSVLYRIGNSAGYSQAFNDVTTGSNGRYQAGPQWDAVTGWGTPNVAGLATAVESLAG